MASREKILVYENWSQSDPVKIGTLHVDAGKGKEVISFEYDEGWLAKSDRDFVFDPELAFYRGRQYTPLDKPMFGIFADSCPDRWGRLLMKRREAILARKEGRPARRLLETDYLIGVYDETRMGALRFSETENGPFLSDSKDLAAPPWTTLRALESASLSFENNDDGMEEKWLNQLIAPGSSLGGARPKASVVTPDNSLWIAKFPSNHDDVNVGAWEMVVHELAILCGISVSVATLENFSKNGSTFLTRRFDRDGQQRIHFASAMTLLEKTDGSGAQDASYLDIASLIRKYGSKPRKDLTELWKRVVFNMAVSNTDDHLRNHGFLLSKEGWQMSPAYDLNPNPDGHTLSLAIDEHNNEIDFELALSVSRWFDLKDNQAKDIQKEIINVVASNWKRLAKMYDLTRREMDSMATAFEWR